MNLYTYRETATGCTNSVAFLEKLYISVGKYILINYYEK